MRAILAFFAVSVIVSYGTPSLYLQLNNGSIDGNDFYSININGAQWLQSGQLEAYLDGQWYTANASKATNDATYSHMKLISSSLVYDRYDDFGGQYTLFAFEWQAGTVILETNIKQYTDNKAISFVQSFPFGVPNTHYMSASLPTKCGGDSYLVPPFLSFPSFNVVNTSSLYARGSLGYLTWTNTFCKGLSAKTPLSTDDLAGINGGPVVLFDDTALNAIVVSTNDHFDVSTQLNQLTSSNVATLMNDSARNDSLFCLSSECYNANANYQNRQYQGIAAPTSSTGEEVVALTLWYSDQHQDNYVAVIGPPDNTYTISFANGYIYKNNDAEHSRFSVDLFYNAVRQDHATVATPQLKQILKGQGYQFLATLGYIVANASDASMNNDWRLGISAQVLEVPQGFQHETVIVVGSGIHDAVLNEWSSRLQSKYHTSRIEGEKDIVTAYLGYWTDNGAYYYGDSCGATTDPLNLTCCSLDVLKQVKAKLDAQSIPIRYWQMDDWWYIGDHPQDFHLGGWGGVKGVAHWEPPAEFYPGGLAALSEALQVPLLLYGPYFAPNNDWVGEYEFVPQEAGFVLPSPEDSYAFYSTLLDFGINASTTQRNTGMVAYEVDFMSCLSGTPEFRVEIGAQQQWLDGMNQAAEERGLTIQYCMATPMDLMQSLSLAQVTNGRASDDYASSLNWDIGTTAILFSALGLKPSKDNIWTSFDEQPLPECHPYGSDHNSTDVHVIVAVLSCGPVGISDAVGMTNSTLIMRTCRSDGRLLQPARPITAIDDTFIQCVFNKQCMNVWSTEFGPYDAAGNVGILGHIVFAVDLQSDYSLSYESLNLQQNFMYIVRDWYEYQHCKNGTLALQNGCVRLVEANSNSLYTLTPQPVIAPMLESFELIQIIEQVALSKIVLLGELDKIVSISQHRFEDLVINGMSLSVTVKGGANEKVYVSLLMPTQNQTDWTLFTYEVLVGSDGMTQFNV